MRTKREIMKTTNSKVYEAGERLKKKAISSIKEQLQYLLGKLDVIELLSDDDWAQLEREVKTYKNKRINDYTHRMS